MTKGRLVRLKSKDSVLWWWSQKHSAVAYAWQGSHLLYLLAFHLAGPFACANYKFLFTHTPNLLAHSFESDDTDEAHTLVSTDLKRGKSDRASL